MSWFDAYRYSWRTLTWDEAGIPQRALRHDIMFAMVEGHGEPRVYSYNIAMMLYAVFVKKKV